MPRAKNEHPNIASIATCFRGSKKHQKKFAGRVGDARVVDWLRQIDGLSANVQVRYTGGWLDGEEREVFNPD